MRGSGTGAAGARRRVERLAGWCVLAGIAAGVAAGPVAAQGGAPLIDVTKAADRRIAIGVGKYPGISGSEVGSPPGEVVAYDFELTGWFQAVLPGAVPPSGLGDWGRLGAELVVELGLEGKSLDAAVRDVGTGDILFRRQYDPQPGESLRARIHRFVDEAVGALTGQKGLARTRLLCEWDPGDGKRIVVMDIDGFGMKPLTGDKALELSPRWTADGRKAIYTSYRSGYPDVYIQTLATGARDKTAHYEGVNAQGDLSPDGRTLALMLSFQGNPEIYAKDMASSRLHRLTSHPATDATPVWSPDGRRIAFVSDRTGSPQIYVMDADGSRTERVTVRGSYNTAPDWSPDGSRVAYCALRSDGFQIQVLELESGKVTTITDLSGCEDPSWSPDGRSILFSRKSGGRADLYVVDVNEQRTLKVSRGSGRYSAPDWSPLP